MTRDDFSNAIVMEISDRIAQAVQDLYRFCDDHGEPLTRQQRFAVGSLPLRVVLGLDETLESMTHTYDAIRALTPELPDWPDELAAAWLRGTPTERTH